MECNRDEAVRAKEIAEKRFLAKDIKGAKKFALKAKNLYPELEGLSQMLMTLEVYISAEEEKIHGESNWYGVLGVTSLADDETIRKQYRKLALVLHPDKNRSIGAEGAFQLVSQAWSLLSDKSKRTAYDQRCGKASQQRNQTKNEGPSTQNGFNNANTAASQVRLQKGNNTKRNPSSGPHVSRKKERRTFWTVCHRCKMQYEYLRMYLNHNLLCPNCHEAYFAIEICPPSNKASKVPQTSNSQQQKNINQWEHDAKRNKSSTHNGSNHNNFQWVPFSDSTGAQSAVQAANMVQQAYEKVKRERQKAQAAARREETLHRKNLASKRTAGGESSGQFDASKRRKGIGDCGVNKEKMGQDSIRKRISKRDGACHVSIRDLLIEKVCDEVHKKFNQCISTAMVRNEAGEETLNSKKDKETAIINDGFMCSTNKLRESLESENQFPMNKLDPYLEQEMVRQMSVDVLDPDFHDFDKTRTDQCVRENEVWAVYDDDDGMPRHYAMIQDVISLNPFKVKMSWLTTQSRVGKVSWLSSGFMETWGEFREGRYAICSSTQCFSHKVTWTKSTSKIFIFPRKGDIWALYRNWSPEWNELTEDEVIHQYDMVEVLEDYDEELGVIVIPLLKVVGFKAVFHQHFNSSEIRRIPKEEMSRFSHQVPSHLLTGQEGIKSPKGCLELDPAAVPLQFLQAVSDVEEIEFMETDEDIELVKAVDCVHSVSTNMAEGIS